MKASDFREKLWNSVTANLPLVRDLICYAEMVEHGNSYLENRIQELVRGNKELVKALRPMHDATQLALSKPHTSGRGTVGENLSLERNEDFFIRINLAEANAIAEVLAKAEGKK